MLIINFHNVLAAMPGALSAQLRRGEWDSLAEFERQIAALAARYEFVPLRALAEAIRGGKPRENVCAITFDDGCRGAYQYARPVLKRFGVSAAFFIITQRVRGALPARPTCFDRLEALLALTEQTVLDLSDYDDEVYSLASDAEKNAFYKIFRRHSKVTPAEMNERLVAAIARQLEVPEEKLAAYLRHEAYEMMSWEEIGALQREGHEIGGHTRTHPALRQCHAAQLESEIFGCFADLRERLGNHAFPFAYPYGKPKHISEAAIAAVQRAGFACAVTMKEGVNTPDTNLFKLRRVSFAAWRMEHGA